MGNGSSDSSGEKTGRPIGERRLKRGGKSLLKRSARLARQRSPEPRKADIDACRVSGTSLQRQQNCPNYDSLTGCTLQTCTC